MLKLSLEHPTIRLILSDLSFGPATARDLSHSINMQKRTVYTAVKFLKKAKQIRISGWERKQGGPVAVFSLGNSKDAKKLKPLTQKERKQRSRENKFRRRLTNVSNRA